MVRTSKESARYNTTQGGVPSENLKRPLNLQGLNEILSSIIKYDETNKIITFLGLLLTYTDQDQINIGYTGESSVGKTYIVNEVSAYFLDEDVSELAYSSPTAFYHEEGEWDEELLIFRINLEKRILIFFDQPHN